MKSFKNEINNALFGVKIANIRNSESMLEVKHPSESFPFCTIRAGKRDTFTVSDIKVHGFKELRAMEEIEQGVNVPLDVAINQVKGLYLMSIAKKGEAFEFGNGDKGVYQKDGSVLFQQDGNDNERLLFSAPDKLASFIANGNTGVTHKAQVAIQSEGSEIKWGDWSKRPGDVQSATDVSSWFQNKQDQNGADRNNDQQRVSSKREQFSPSM